METWGASSKERLVQEWDRMLAKGRGQELGNEGVYEWVNASNLSWNSQYFNNDGFA